jgi:hypothetical protein
VRPLGDGDVGSVHLALAVDHLEPDGKCFYAADLNGAANSRALI